MTTITLNDFSPHVVGELKKGVSFTMKHPYRDREFQNVDLWVDVLKFFIGGSPSKRVAPLMQRIENLCISKEEAADFLREVDEMASLKEVYFNQKGNCSFLVEVLKKGKQIVQDLVLNDLFSLEGIDAYVEEGHPLYNRRGDLHSVEVRVRTSVHNEGTILVMYNRINPEVWFTSGVREEECSVLLEGRGVEYIVDLLYEWYGGPPDGGRDN